MGRPIDRYRQTPKPDPIAVEGGTSSQGPRSRLITAVQSSAGSEIVCPIGLAGHFYGYAPVVSVAYPVYTRSEIVWEGNVHVV